MPRDEEDDRESSMSFILNEDEPLQRKLTEYMMAIQKATDAFSPLDPGVFVGALLTIAAPVMHVQLEFTREQCLEAMGKAFDTTIGAIRLAHEA